MMWWCDMGSAGLTPDSSMLRQYDERCIKAQELGSLVASFAEWRFSTTTTPAPQLLNLVLGICAVHVLSESFQLLLFCLLVSGHGMKIRSILDEALNPVPANFLDDTSLTI
ncbi:hypothetical protein DPSP01_002268 [Paraphaeosphaeria sporulosa]